MTLFLNFLLLSSDYRNNFTACSKLSENDNVDFEKPILIDYLISSYIIANFYRLIIPKFPILK